MHSFRICATSRRQYEIRDDGKEGRFINGKKFIAPSFAKGTSICNLMNYDRDAVPCAVLHLSSQH